MKFIVDAQLPKRLAVLIAGFGHDVLHTVDLPNGNRTTGADINALSFRENRIVITKDSDFVTSYTLTGLPYKLLLISTGNISNNALESIILTNLATVVDAFETAGFIELAGNAVIIHI